MHLWCGILLAEALFQPSSGRQASAVALSSAWRWWQVCAVSSSWRIVPAWRVVLVLRRKWSGKIPGLIHTSAPSLNLCGTFVSYPQMGSASVVVIRATTETLLVSAQGHHSIQRRNGTDRR